MGWVRNFFSRQRRYEELSESMREHLDERIEELVEGGMGRKEAEYAAKREFGNVTQIEERSREVWQWPRVESLWADARLAMRRLGRAPGFATTAILTLAIGIGANTAVFSVVNSVLLRPLPYPHAEQLVSLRLQAPGAEGLADFRDQLRLSGSMYFTFTEQNRTFQSLGVWSRRTVNVTGLAQPEEVCAALISDGVLETLDVPPAVGRWLAHADQDPHSAGPVMLSYGYWQRRFGGDRGVIGRNIQVDAQARQIVGVMPRGFRVVDGDWNFDVLEPMALDRNAQPLAGFGLMGVARMKPGVTVAEANADVARLIPVWMDSWTNGPGTDPHWYVQWRITPHLLPLKQEVIGSVGSVLWVVMATLGLVMLIAWTNVANLLLVRAEARHLELSIRAALGAGRWRIARELLVESVLLGLIGGVIAVGVAYGGVRLLLAMGPTNLPRLNEISLDEWSLGFALVLAVMSGLVLGSIPVWRYARGEKALAVSSGGRTASASRERHRSRNVLVVAQVAMALVLLVGATLMIRTFEHLRHVDPGFADARHVQTVRIGIPESMIPDPAMVARTQNEIVDELAAIPGVQSVGFAAAAPMEGIEPNWNLIFKEGADEKGNDHPPMRLFNYVSPNYFRTMETPVIAGREFMWAEVHGPRPVAILSKGLAREMFGSPQAAIGKRIREFSVWHEVVGVVADVHENGIDQPSPAMVYWPPKPGDIPGLKTLDFARGATFVLRSERAGSEALVSEAQRAVWRVNANLPVASLRTMEETASASLARTSFTLTMLAIAGSMALVLGVIGIYGVISYTVSQRRREIGIRLALGAQRSGLRWMFVRSALALTGIGVGIGLGAAAGLTRLMKSLLFGVSPLDPVTYVSIPLVLAACAVLASYLPARRAAGVDPVEALRSE
jgi:predicted permease